MYHLFRKVYVESEWRIDRRRDSITISPKIGFQHIPGPDETGKQLGYSVSLDSLSENEFRDLFMKAYMSDDRVMVYVDGETYVRLYSLLVKALLPNVDLETFQWIMVCKKATFNVSMSNSQKLTTDIVDEVVINRTSVQAYFDQDDRFVDVMRDILSIDPDSISLEWRIWRLKANNVVGTLPDTLRTLLRRIAVANTYDALDVWGRFMTDPEYWEFAGCSLETLLDAPTVFQGALNMVYTSNPMFLRPGAFNATYGDEWICGLLEELIPMLDKCIEGPTRDRTIVILDLLMREADLNDPVVCLDQLMTMFHGSKRLAMPNHDTGKYDENLIRYILSTDKAKLQQCVEGAEW